MHGGLKDRRWFPAVKEHSRTHDFWDVGCAFCPGHLPPTQILIHFLLTEILVFLHMKLKKKISNRCFIVQLSPFLFVHFERAIAKKNPDLAGVDICHCCCKDCAHTSQPQEDTHLPTRSI